MGEASGHLARSLGDGRSKLDLTDCFILVERNGVRGNTEIQRLFEMSMSAIRQEIEANHAPLKGDVTVLEILLNKIPTFR